MKTMAIGINPGNLQSSEAIVAWTERKVRTSLRRLAPRITRVEVHFEDLNGPKDGRADRRCAMEARINGRKPLAVEHRAEDLYTAIDGAARRLRTALSRAVDRVKTRAQRIARRRTRGTGLPPVRATSTQGPATAASRPRALDRSLGTIGRDHALGTSIGDSEPRVAGGGKHHVIIAGYGPVGRTLANVLSERGVPIIIIERNARTVETQTSLGRTIVHGDATDPSVLASAGIHDAAAFAITVSDSDAACTASQAARSLSPAIFIAARTRHLSQALRAKQMGADAVTVEEIVTAQAMGTSVADVLGYRGRHTCEGAD